jgi:hypothetical protein
VNLPVKIGLIALVGAVVGYGGLALYDAYRKPVPVGGASVPAVAAPAVRGAPKVKVVVKAPVTTLQGGSKADLKLPAAVIADEHKQVIDASQVRSSLRPQTVSTVIDTETGDVKTYVKTDPYPWLAIETRGEIGVAYGYKYSSTTHAPAQVGRLQFSYDAVRVKALTIGVTATLDTDRDAFAGVAIKYKW